MKILQTIKSYPKVFWILNVMQMTERLAFWVTLLQMPVYIAQKDTHGGLQWEQTSKGIIFFAWAIVQNLTPIFSGGFTDIIGYKKTLVISFILAISGYLLIGLAGSFYFMVAAVCILGLGLGVYKPALQGSLALSLNEENSSTGWAINNMMVNSAVFLGVPATIFLKGISYQAVFIGSALIFSLHFIYILFYRDFNIINRKFENPLSIIKTIFNQLRKPGLLIFILLMSGFTMIYMQFYETLPNFIIDWSDTSNEASIGLPGFMLRNNMDLPMIAYEWLYNINTAMIVVFVVAASRLLSKISVTKSISIGILLSAIGFWLCGASMSGFILIAGFILYTFGEMISNPKFNEYLALLAPSSHKSLYMSYLNISWAIGLGGGSLIGGSLYKHFGEKSGLALDYISRNYPSFQLLDKSFAFNKLTEFTGMSPLETTRLLWSTYHPEYLWLPFVGIGLISALILWYLNRSSKLLRN